LLKTLDKLAPTIVAVMMLFAVMNVTIFLVFEGLAPRTHVSDDHGVLLTFIEEIDVFESTVPQKSVGEHYMELHYQQDYDSRMEAQDCSRKGLYHRRMPEPGACITGTDVPLEIIS
jgi:hypothetical protein